MINLEVIKSEGGEYSAYATVTDVVTESIVVRFRLDDKALKPVLVSTPGQKKNPAPRTALAECNLGKVKVGNHLVTAEALGQQAEERFEAEETYRKVGGMEWVWSGMFILLSLMFGYRGFISVGIIATLGILGLLAARKGGDFGKKFFGRVRDNDWVFYTYLSLFLISLVLFLSGFSGTPLPELNPLEWAAGKLKDVVLQPPTDPWANDGIGPWFTRLLLGSDGGWGGATLFFLICLPFAWASSFQDNFRESWEKKREKGGDGGHRRGFGRGFLLDGIYEVIWGVLGHLFGGKGGKS